MASVNKITLLGHVGKTPEVRYSQSGEAITSFSIATTEKWTDKSGQKQERTEWHSVSVFGKLAEIARDFVTKGKQVYVEGSLRTEEWKDKDGQPRKTTKVNLSGPRAVLVLLGGRGEAAAPAERQAGEDDFDTDPF